MRLVRDISELIGKLGDARGTHRLIGIDGRPCSGKTTLATRLSRELNAQILHLDDFVLPREQWSNEIKPAFPFPYIRFDEFERCIRGLAGSNDVSFHRYDWKTGAIESSLTTIAAKGPILVEGVSALAPRLRPYYWKSVFVLSDVTSELSALENREAPESMNLWKSLFLPSAEIHFTSRPWDAADYTFSGRGIP